MSGWFWRERPDLDTTAEAASDGSPRVLQPSQPSPRLSNCSRRCYNA
jgi:hypothetical protein